MDATNNTNVHPDLIFTIRVGYTTSRPVIADEHVVHIRVSAVDHIEAGLTAHDMVAVGFMAHDTAIGGFAGGAQQKHKKGVVMVTRIDIVDVIA